MKTLSKLYNELNITEASKLMPKSVDLSKKEMRFLKSVYKNGGKSGGHVEYASSEIAIVDALVKKHVVSYGDAGTVKLTMTGISVMNKKYK